MVQKTNQFKSGEEKSGQVENKKGKKPKQATGKPAFSFLKDPKFQRIIGIFCLLFSVYLLLAFFSYLQSWFSHWPDDAFNQHLTLKKIFTDYPEQVSNWMGRSGAILSHLFIKEWFGVAAALFPLAFFVAGWKLLKVNVLHLGKTLRYSFFGLVWISVTLGFFLKKGFIFTNEDYEILGGRVGWQVSGWLEGFMGRMGIVLLLIFTFLSFLVIAVNLELRLKKHAETGSGPVPGENEDEHLSLADKLRVDEEDENENGEEAQTVEFTLHKSDGDTPKDFANSFARPRNVKQGLSSEENSEVELIVEEEPASSVAGDHPSGPVPRQTLDTPYDPTLELSGYKSPPLDLLDDYGSSSVTVQKEELEENKDRIVHTLGNYSIQIDKIKATIGPTVTLYEIIPAPGVRISKIKNLEDDIALSLSAMGIRIIAPIPGKGTIGIEVPNQKPEIVGIRSILGSEKFLNTKYELPIALGKTISNETFVSDLTKMPHLLMAGATGQGKSVGLNCIIASLLYKKHPSQVKFIMVDPKKVELTLFSKIERHFLAKLPDAEEAIITDTRKVVRTLNSLCIEMESRYDLLKDAQVRNVKEYNEKFIARRLNPNEGHHFLPYLVLVIDEFADFIMTAGKEVETPLTRLAQLARATGIHLVIATQRPSVNIITGSIKANFPARVAFRVISKIDSRTILDSGGADQLIGRGDMLLSMGSDLIRLQCAFVDTHEVDKVTEFIGSQRGYPDAFNLPEYYEEGAENALDYDPTQRDEMFEDAARLIVQHQQGSTSLLQRKLKLGYNRAGRIIDQLEAAGIVGPFEGSKAREVKITDLNYLEQHLRDLNPNS